MLRLVDRWTVTHHISCNFWHVPWLPHYILLRCKPIFSLGIWVEHAGSLPLFVIRTVSIGCSSLRFEHSNILTSLTAHFLIDIQYLDWQQNLFLIWYRRGSLRSIYLWLESWRYLVTLFMNAFVQRKGRNSFAAIKQSKNKLPWVISQVKRNRATLNALFISLGMQNLFLSNWHQLNFVFSSSWIVTKGLLVIVHTQ